MNLRKSVSKMPAFELFHKRFLKNAGRKVQGARFEAQESRHKNQGTRIKAQET